MSGPAFRDGDQRAYVPVAVQDLTDREIARWLLVLRDEVIVPEREEAMLDEWSQLDAELQRRRAR
jgi:hypothetical protein